MDIARDLGWNEEGAPAAVTGGTEERAAAAAAAEERGGGGSGMGVSVSVMSSPPEEDEDESASGLHAYAMRDDVAAMSAFLQAGGEEGGLEIDARDEYVRKELLRGALCQPANHICFLFFVGIHGTAFGCRSRERRRNRAFTQARRR